MSVKRIIEGCSLEGFDLTSRAPQEDLRRQYGVVLSKHDVASLLNMMALPVMILNQHRQVVFMNTTCRKLINIMGYAEDAYLGQRPGEILSCVNATVTPFGCGTAEGCRQCGAFKSIFTSIHWDITDENECRILKKDTSEALDLRVTTTPYQMGDESLVLLTFADISAEKRRAVLEKVFFHDILNLAGAVQGSSEMLTQRPVIDDSCRRLAEIVHTGALSLVKEIQMHQSLLSAEHNELTVLVELVDPVELLKNLAEMYRHHQESTLRHIVVDMGEAVRPIETDSTILSRILGNMIKNGLEAAALNGKVVVGVFQTTTGARFTVHNDAVIAREVQLQIFQRSFSTKGRGRGVGTYSIKLLTERYLGGIVTFLSTPEEGTTFILDIPEKFIQQKH